MLFITWWDELTSSEFDKYNKELVKFVKQNVKYDINDVYYMMNNGRLVKYDENKKSKDIKSSNKRKKFIQIQQAIHLANQKAKDKFFKDFKRYRDENNQKKYYNHTKSKTEAEWRSIRYIGDSLIQK